MPAPHSILILLVFFPSVTFGLIGAEIFPWAVICAVFLLRELPKNAFIPTAALLGWLGLSTLLSTLSYADADAIRSLVAYLNPIAAFLTFLTLSPTHVKKTISLANKVLIVLIGLGLLQFAGLISFLEPYLTFLVPRASVEALHEMGGRGVTLLSSEPSRAGVELVLLYLLFRMTSDYGARIIFVDLALLAFLAVVIRAAQPLTFGVFVIGALLVKKPSQIGLALLALLIVPFINLDFGMTRALFLIERLWEQSDLNSMVFFAVNESGHRLLTIYTFFQYGVSHPLGGGIGAWPITSMEAIKQSGIDIGMLRYFAIHGEGWVVAVRGSGLVSNLMLDVGIIGTALFFVWILRSTHSYRQNNRDTWLIMTILFVKIMFIGSVGEPLPWVVAALALRYCAANAPGHASATPRRAPNTPSNVYSRGQAGSRNA